MIDDILSTVDCVRTVRYLLGCFFPGATEDKDVAKAKDKKDGIQHSSCK